MGGKAFLPHGDFQIESGSDFGNDPKHPKLNGANGADNHSEIAVYFYLALAANGFEVIFFKENMK